MEHELNLTSAVDDFTESAEPGIAEENNLAQEAPEEEMSLEDLADAFEVRAQTYSFLSRLYNTEVDEAYLEELKAMRFPVESGNELMNDGYYHIAKYLSNEWADPITKLATDYFGAFVGGGIDTYSAAYPFESVYTSERRLTMQGARDEVLAIYRANGLEKSSSWKIGEDHIAVELEFMRILVARTMRALRAGNEDKAMHLIATQRNFLEDHLNVWVPVFAADIRRFSKTMFYAGVAELTEGFLQTETALLADMIMPDESEDSAKAEVGAGKIGVTASATE